jgi:hypothetical protein
MRATAEDAAADAVLGFGISAAKYADELLSVAEAAQEGMGAVTAMVRPGGVGSLILRIVA